MHNKYKSRKRPPLVRKAQGGLSLPAYYGATGDITSLNNDLQQYAKSANVLNSIASSDKAKGLTTFFGKAGVLSKANNALPKSVGGIQGMPSIGGLATSALSVADKFIPQAEDKGSKITSGVFNGLSQVAGMIPGVGTIASVALKGLGTLFGAGVKSVKGNAADEMVDTSSSYTGADAYDSKRFGLLGLGSAKKYQKKVDKRQWERDTAHDVLQEGKDDLLASSNVQQLQLVDNLNKNASDWMYNIRAGEFGMKIKEAKRLSRLAKKKVSISGEPRKIGTTELREGGNIPKNTSMSGVESSTEISLTGVKQQYQEGESGQQAPEIFQNGGQVNIIPEGALHARKHNLVELNPELEGITKKGIPVITQEEGGIVQHAEIERSEIIFTKEITDKLEELRNIGTDEAAIEAGKLLAEQIIENTIDNTGELLHDN